MSGSSNIAWTNATWNPLRGCERVSEGCRNCYAEELAARHSYRGGWGEGIAEWVMRPGGEREARWTGKIQPVEAALDWPLRRRAPSRIFVNSMSDLFHKDVPDSFIDKVFNVMESVGAGKHIFQILTKRADRMRAYLWRRWSGGPVPAAMRKNIWLGVSVEDQKTADERIPLLLGTPGAVRWISAEPLLGPIDLLPYFRGFERPAPWHVLDWVVIGGESGSGRRELDMQHARAIGHDCVACNVPVFIKQDSGPRPGMQGRFTDEEWALKEYPA